MENHGGITISEPERMESKARPQTEKACELVLRVLALALTLGAAILIGVDKQTKVVSVKVSDGLPPFNVPVTAKWHYLSAFLYFVVANAIACVYATVSLVFAIANRGGTKKGLLRAIIIILDAVMVALLFSGNGAALAVGVIGFQGNSHVQWNKVCNNFGKFCDQVAAAAILSLLAAISFLFLLLLPMLHRTT